MRCRPLHEGSTIGSFCLGLSRKSSLGRWRRSKTISSRSKLTSNLAAASTKESLGYSATSKKMGIPLGRTPEFIANLIIAREKAKWSALT